MVLTLLALLTVADASPAEKLARDGRHMTYLGATLMTTGTPFLMSSGLGLSYGGTTVAGSTLVGMGGPLFLSGTLVEMVGLQRLTGASTLIGWSGFALISVGGSAAAGFIAGGEPGSGLIVGSSLAGIGMILIFAQSGINVRNSYMLKVPDRQQIYRPRRVSMVLTPTVLEGGAGVAFAGVW